MPIDHQPNTIDDLIEYRLTKLEQQYSEMKIDLKSMMDVLNRLDKKFSIIPEAGFQCNIHALKMDTLQKELNNHKDVLDEHKLILDELSQFKWRSIGILSVIILLVQIAGSAVIDKFIKPDTRFDPIKIELISPNIQTNLTPTIK